MEYNIINLISKGRYFKCLPLLFFFILSSVSAQNLSMPDSSINKLASYKSGVLEVSCKHKYFFESDTFLKKQSLIFYNDTNGLSNVLFTQDSSLYIIRGEQYIYSYGILNQEVYFQELNDNSDTRLIPYNFYLNGGNGLRNIIQNKNNVIKEDSDYKQNDYRKFIIYNSVPDKDYPDFGNDRFNIYLNNQTYLPDRIVFTVDYLNSYTQYDDIKIIPRHLYEEINTVIRDSIDNTFNNLYERYQRQPQDDTTNKKNEKVNSFVSVSPSWSLPKLDGDTFHLQDIDAGFILIDFWYVSCYPCLSAIKELVILDTLYTDNVLKIIGVNVYDKEIGKIQKIMEQLHIQYDVVYQGKTISEMYGGGIGYPKLVLIDNKSKKIIFAKSGYYKGFINDIIKIINKNSSDLE